MDNNEIVIFTDNNIKLEVPVSPNQETVWLTQEQMSELFDTARSSIAYHIGNIFAEGEVDKSTSVENFDRNDGKKIISDYTLVALTIMIAESNPKEKEMMINIIMNCLQ